MALSKKWIRKSLVLYDAVRFSISPLTILQALPPSHFTFATTKLIPSSPLVLSGSPLGHSLGVTPITFYGQSFRKVRALALFAIQRKIGCMVLPLACFGRVRAVATMGGGGRGVVTGEQRGALIVLEGLDRSGKSSQCKALATFLRSRGESVEEWRFPDRTTEMGRTISSYLAGTSEVDDEAVHLLFSANRWEKRKLMEATLSAGTTLVVDRYAYSGVAFTAAKGLDLDWCKAQDKGLPAADLVLYLDIPPEVAAQRGEYGRERYEKLEFQQKVASYYQALQDSTWQQVDASQSLDVVQEVIREASLSVIESCRSGSELLRLWPVKGFKFPDAPVLYQ